MAPAGSNAYLCICVFSKCDDVNGSNDDSDSSNNDDRVDDGKHDDDGYNNSHMGYCTPYLHVLCIVFVQINMKLKQRLFLP